MDKLQDSYTKADDAVRNKVDQFFSNSQADNPQINFFVADSQLEMDIESGRLLLNNLLKTWKISVDQLTTAYDFSLSLSEMKKNLDQVKSLLDKVALAINNPTNKSSNVSQTTWDGWKMDVSTARTNINTAKTNLTTAEEKLKNTESNLTLAEDELTFKRAKARTEDVQIAEAKMEEIEGQIAIIKEKIKKSTLYAPVSAKIINIGIERQELSRPGQTAITLATTGHKIQADISELEIGKIRENDPKGQVNGAGGNEVSVRFDAFPDRSLNGKVVSVDAKEIIKDGDKYYRVNIYLDQHGAEIRSGMNADLVILVSSKKDILKIPELAVYKKDGVKFVTILEEGKQKEVKVETGISDGESVEVVKGLREGQTIMVSAD